MQSTRKLREGQIEKKVGFMNPLNKGFFFKVSIFTVIVQTYQALIQILQVF